jgi:hypothetical protein
METEPTNAELAESIGALSKQIETLAQTVVMTMASKDDLAKLESRFDRLDGASLTTYKLYQDLEMRVVQLEKVVEPGDKI